LKKKGGNLNLSVNWLNYSALSSLFSLSIFQERKFRDLAMIRGRQAEHLLFKSQIYNEY